jgi:hypothetical protein
VVKEGKEQNVLKGTLKARQPKLARPGHLLTVGHSGEET